MSGEVSDVCYVPLSPGDQETAHLLRGEARLGRQHEALAEPGAAHLALHLAGRRSELPQYNLFNCIGSQIPSLHSLHRTSLKGITTGLLASFTCEHEK